MYQPYQSGIYQQNLQHQPNPQPFVPQADTIFVNGVNEAAAWVVQRGQTVRLWDVNEPKFYVKSVGENGMPNPIEVYRYERDIAPVEKETPKVEYVTRKEFEERIAALTKPQKAKKKEVDDELDV